MEVMEYSDLVTVRTVADPVQAEIVKNALHAEGVRRCLERVHQAGAARPVALDIKVQVRTGNADRGISQVPRAAA
jgi:hypothetical protein